MNILTKFYLNIMYQCWDMDKSFHIVKCILAKVTNHSSVTICVNCVYASNKNTPVEF